MTEKKWKAHVEEIESDPYKRVEVETGLTQILPSLLQSFQLPLPEGWEELSEKITDMEVEDLAHVAQYATVLQKFDTDVQEMFAAEILPQMEVFQADLTEKLTALEPIPEEGEELPEPGMLTAFYEGFNDYLVEGGKKIIDAIGLDLTEELTAAVEGYAGQMLMQMVQSGGMENYILQVEMQRYQMGLLDTWMEENAESDIVTTQTELEAKSEEIYSTLEKYFPPQTGMDMEALMAMLGGNAEIMELNPEETGCGDCSGDCGTEYEAPERPEPSEGDEDIKSS